MAFLLPFASKPDLSATAPAEMGGSQSIGGPNKFVGTTTKENKYRVQFLPVERTQTRCTLEMTYCMIGSYTSWRLSGAIATNFAANKDKPLLEIPGEVSQVVMKINKEAGEINNIGLFFWILVLLCGIVGFGITMYLSESVFESSAVALAALCFVPSVIAMSMINLVLADIKLLTAKYSETHYLRCRSKFVPFWTSGGGFFCRDDAIICGLGFGIRIIVFTELEYGPPRICIHEEPNSEKRPKSFHNFGRGGMETLANMGKSFRSAGTVRHLSTGLRSSFRKLSSTTRSSTGSTPAHHHLQVIPQAGGGSQPNTGMKTKRKRGSIAF